jgi:molybdate transport repressor ModE-like protein
MEMSSGQLRLLVEIKRTGSLARAALNLSVSPPAVSQQLAKLEREVGAALVERGTRGTRLTELGERLAGHGERVMDELAEASETAAGFIGAHVNRLRVGAPPSLSMTLLPEALAAARYRAPKAELSVIEVKSDEGPTLVAAGELDVALSARYTQLLTTEPLTVHHLLDDPLVAVLPDDHPLAGQPNRPIGLQELSEEQWASGPPGRPSRVQLEDAAAREGFVPQVPFVTESYDVAQSLADSGVAVSLVPRLALNPRLSTTIRSLRQPVARSIVAVVPSDTDHIPLAVEFVRDLRNIAKAAGS